MIAYSKKASKSGFTIYDKAALDKLKSKIDSQLAQGVYKIHLTNDEYHLLNRLSVSYDTFVETIYRNWLYRFQCQDGKKVSVISKMSYRKPNKHFSFYTNLFEGFSWKCRKRFFEKRNLMYAIVFKIHCTDANFAANLKAYPNQLKHFDTSEVSDFSPLDTNLSGFEHWNTTNINTCIAPKGAIKSKWQMIWNYECGERQKACAALESELIALSLTDLVNTDSFFGILNEKSLPKTILYRISDFVVDVID